MSVTIVDVKERTAQDGNPFMAFIVQKELELVTSKSGNIYVSAHRASIPCTLDFDTAKMMIGKELPGTIERVLCQTYERTNENGDVVSYNHRYQYVPENNITEVHQEEEVMELETEEVV